MPAYFVTGTTGGGKGTYATMKIKEALDNNKRVATNVNLYLEHVTSKNNNSLVTRLPDKPRASDFYDLGFGSQQDNQNKDDYGLLVLDEISLFLQSKREKEFDALMAWIVQRRKFHWDIIFIAQSKDQVQETLYKSLCDQLVICKAKDLVPVPYLGGIMRFIGLKGVLPEGHIAFTFSGRSENDVIARTEEYKNHPYRKMYNTDQVFSDGFELVGSQLLDMRACYSYLPHSILSGQKYIDEHISAIKRITETRKKEKKVAKINNMGGRLALKLKAGFMIGLVVLVFTFNNPFNNQLLAGNETASISSDKSEKLPFVSEVNAKEQVNQSKVHGQPVTPKDYLLSLFSSHNYRTSGVIVSNNIIYGTLLFSGVDGFSQVISFSDIQRFGFIIEKLDSSLIITDIDTGFKTVVLFNKDLSFNSSIDVNTNIQTQGNSLGSIPSLF